MDAHLPQREGVGGVMAAGSRNHVFAVIAATVLVLGLARALLVVANDPVLGYMPQGGAAPAQWSGAVMLALIAAVAAVTAIALRHHAVASLVHALVFFLIVSDPVASLWLNSMQPESWALVGAYGATSMVAAIAFGASSRLHVAMLLAALVAIAMGPRALALLPATVVAVTWPMLHSRLGVQSWFAAATAIVVAVLAFAMATRAPETHAAGASVMPASAAESARVAEPLRSLRAIARDLPASATLAPAALDISASPRVRHLGDLPPYVMSFTGLLADFPVTVWMMLYMTIMLTAPFAVLAVTWSMRRAPDVAGVFAAYAALSAIAAYVAIAVAMNADGDVARNLWLGSLGMLAAVIVLPLAATTLSRDAWAGPVALVIAFGIVLLAAGWLVWSRQQPIAIGALERIDAGPNKSLEVSGWALDPRGVRRVFATVGGGPVTEATRGTERLDVQAHYPGYPDAVSGGFQMTIASNAWRPDQLLRVYVENRTGAVTEIDRRIVRVR